MGRRFDGVCLKYIEVIDHEFWCVRCEKDDGFGLLVVAGEWKTMSAQPEVENVLYKQERGMRTRGWYNSELYRAILCIVQSSEVSL